MSDLTSAARQPLRSQFADDADFRELLEDFVAALPERSRRLAELHSGGLIEELARQAHQLKGAGGGYGFPEISEAGGELQDACREQNAATIDECVVELLALLERVEA
jgi:HPt (histidine-containing phosphotransfer) domain-containing protein